MDRHQIKAVITGGGSGLGLATAQQFLQAGGAVTLLDRNDEALAHAKSTLDSGKTHTITADVTNEHALQVAMEEAQGRMAGLTVLVNCAGVLGAGRVLGREAPMALADFKQTIEVNLIGSFNAAKAAANLMQHNEGAEKGVIIHTASVAAYEGQIGQAAYSASKGGVVGMTLPMARELARFGIRVMTIAPGVFHTPMVDGMSEEVQVALAQGIPFPKRLGNPSEYGALALHIVENEYFNGSVIRLDGAVRLEPK
jgi:NAD(P)-dependent dehydrogenase (short-subunit alcohol dehydrogenase family)